MRCAACHRPICRKPVEVRTCNRFLRSELEAIRPLRVVLALGVLAHSAVLAACGIPVSRLRFRHGQILTLPDGLLLADSYHVSRYNTNTGRLTTAMFESVVADLTRLPAATRPRYLSAGHPGSGRSPRRDAIRAATRRVPRR